MALLKVSVVMASVAVPPSVVLACMTGSAVVVSPSTVTSAVTGSTVVASPPTVTSSVATSVVVVVASETAVVSGRSTNQRLHK